MSFQGSPPRRSELVLELGAYVDPQVTWEGYCVVSTGARVTGTSHLSDSMIGEGAQIHSSKVYKSGVDTGCWVANSLLVDSKVGMGSRIEDSTLESSKTEAGSTIEDHSTVINSRLTEGSKVCRCDIYDSRLSCGGSAYDSLLENRSRVDLGAVVCCSHLTNSRITLGRLVYNKLVADSRQIGYYAGYIPVLLQNHGSQDDRQQFTAAAPQISTSQPSVQTVEEALGHEENPPPPYEIHIPSALDLPTYNVMDDERGPPPSYAQATISNQTILPIRRLSDSRTPVDETPLQTGNPNSSGPVPEESEDWDGTSTEASGINTPPSEDQSMEDNDDFGNFLE